MSSDVMFILKDFVSHDIKLVRCKISTSSRYTTMVFRVADNRYNRNREKRMGFCGKVSGL